MLTFLATVAILIVTAAGQSTCPVKSSQYMQQQQQRCKCGIKTNGQIYIYCARKQLTRLPQFTRSSILYEELILSGNQISVITSNAFNGLRVKRLYLDNNPIVKIEPNALTELANYLEELVISVKASDSSAQQPSLPAKLFKSLLNLKILKLDGLDVTGTGYLTASLFNRTRKLETIHLINSDLRTLSPRALSGVEYSLVELNLDNNKLTDTTIIFREIDNMKRLQRLILSRNNIRRLDRRLSTYQATHRDIGSSSLVNNKPTRALHIDLSFNAINHIDDYAFTGLLLTTTTLNLNNNELNQFQLNFISQLTQLTELSLDYNKISYIPDNLFINSRYLHTLSLKGNFISQIRSEFAFSGLHFNLQRLNLASNRLRTLGDHIFMQTTKLKELNMDRNSLGMHFSTISTKQILNTFAGIESELRTLNLEHNNLAPAHLWSVATLLNIESLRLGNNDLTNLSLPAIEPLTSNLTNLFKFYRNLTTLDMQNTSLYQIPYFIGLNRSLTSLNLAKNSLCHVNANNLDKFYSHLSLLNLNSNPLVCNEQLIPLRHWTEKHTKVNSASQQTFNYFSQMSRAFRTDPTLNWKCSEPTHLNNKYFNQLSLKDLSSQQATGYSQCHLDLDNDMYAANLLSTTTTSTQPPSKPHSTIKTVTPLSPSSSAINKILFSMSTSTASIPVANASFLTSMELKQTLLGSLIGALLVLAILLTIFCFLKARTNTHTNHKALASAKSQHISTSSSSSSPYELSKLTLQTMCINSSNNSTASSGSTSSTSNNSSCNHTECSNFFTKMDPLRLTLLNQASMYNPQYLNQNIHYLSTNLPTSPVESMTTSPTNIDNSMLLLNDNTYDKLHQRFGTLNASNNIPSTLNYNQQNHLINKYIQNLNRQLQQTSSSPAETTPFLIIQNMSDVNKLMANEVNMSQDSCSTQLTTPTEYQHTYHEIGDVLVNPQRVARGQTQQKLAVNETASSNNAAANQNEMFI